MDKQTLEEAWEANQAYLQDVSQGKVDTNKLNTANKLYNNATNTNPNSRG